MNILFVTEDHSINNFGVTTVVSQLANQIAGCHNGIQVIIAAIGREPVHQCKAVTIEYIRSSKVGAFWRWSPDLLGRLNDIVGHYHIDLIHVHGIWMAAQWVALKIARDRKIPCIVSSHGMLEPWLWNKQSILKKFKKKIYFNLVFQRTITENTIFHAITQIEKDSLRKLLPKQRIEVIPNAICLEKANIYENGINRIIPEKIFLFLGRLHPIKGVDLLVNAFYQADLGCEWKLILAGPESVPQYVEKLKARVLNLGLLSRVEFTGPIFGDIKQELIRRAWAVVIPSYSEVIGMVNLEASSYKVPSITTFETGLWDWEEGGGVLIHPNVEELTNALHKTLSWTIEERLARGERSYQLVKDRYSWNVIIDQWRDLYKKGLSSSD